MCDGPGGPHGCIRVSRITPVDRQHFGNGRDAGDRLFTKLSYSVGESAQQLAVDVNRAAAHPGDDSGVLWFGTVETRQDHILVRAEDVFENSKNFHIHGFRLCAFKDRIGHTMEAAVHLG